QRAAAEAIRQHPTADAIRDLLSTLSRVPGTDTHLVHTLRIALKQQFLSGGAFERFVSTKPDEQVSKQVADIALAIPSAEAARFLLEYARRTQVNPENLARILKQAARFGGPEV